MQMKQSDLKPHVIAAVERAASVFSVVKFGDVMNNMPPAAPFDSRSLDRTLQALRREKLLKYIGKRDARGKARKRWGWQPVAKRGARRG